MPLEWSPSEWHGNGSHWALRCQRKEWPLGLVHEWHAYNVKVPLLGFSDTLDDAKQAASEIYDVWLDRSGQTIDPPA
jgi:hypothetical protein